MYIFVGTIYLKALLTTLTTVAAPFKICRSFISITIKISQKLHHYVSKPTLYYLMEEMVRLALFNSSVSADRKKAILKAMQDRDSNHDNLKRGESFTGSLSSAGIFYHKVLPQSSL